MQVTSQLRPVERPTLALGGALLQRGDSSPTVRTLQLNLLARGFDPGPLDGIYGHQVEQAVMAFQSANGLAVDGIVGPDTLERLNAVVTPGAIDTRSTWQVSNKIWRNFGHRMVQGTYVNMSPGGRLLWADTQTSVSPHQWAAMASHQREVILAAVPVGMRQTMLANLQNGNPQAVIGPLTSPKPTSPKTLPPTGSRAAQDMANLERVARAASNGKRPDGYCYMHVWNFITRSGYGNMPSEGIPDSHAAEARMFAEYADRNLSRLGLRKLAIDNPYKAPAGAIVVVRAGTPGTAHPTAGDIAVASGDGRFWNGGSMGYGGSGNFPSGNRLVLGIYVPE